MNNINFLQTQQHCPICHQDYFMSHVCTTFTNQTCQKCQTKKNITETIELLTEKKYCPYCGHKL